MAMMLLKEVHKDLEECGIQEEGIRYREVFRKKTAEMKDLPEKITKRSNRMFFEKNEQERTRE